MLKNQVKDTLGKDLAKQGSFTKEKGGKVSFLAMLYVVCCMLYVVCCML